MPSPSNIIEALLAQVPQGHKAVIILLNEEDINEQGANTILVTDLSPAETVALLSTTIDNLTESFGLFVIPNKSSLN